MVAVGAGVSVIGTVVVRAAVGETGVLEEGGKAVGVSRGGAILELEQAAGLTRGRRDETSHDKLEKLIALTNA